VIVPPIVKTIGHYVGLVAVGAGIVIGVEYCRTREAKKALELKPAIVSNTASIDAAAKTQVKTNSDYLKSTGSFKTAAENAHKTPGIAPTTLACFDSALVVISKCDARHSADTALIGLYKKRAQLFEDEAVAARRGKFFGLTGAVGYSGTYGAPAGRVGVALNFADHWSAIGTYDVAAKIRRDSTGGVKVDWKPSNFVGLEYHFGGRH
jgi:hypothetical protein